MKFIRAIKILLAAMLVAVTVPLEAAPPLEAYGKLPTVEEFVISPDGNRYAVVTTLKDKRYLLVVDRSGKTLSAMPVDGVKIRSLNFVSNDIVLMQRSTTEDLGFGFVQDKFEFYQAWIIHVGKQQPELVFSGQRNLIQAIFGDYGIRMVGGVPMAYFGAIELKRANASRTRYEFDHGRPALYEVNLETNVSRRIDVSARPGRDKSWLIDADGTVAARFEISDDGQWSISNNLGGVLVQGEDRLGRASLIALGPEGDTIIYRQRHPASDRTNWFSIPIGGGEPQEFLPNESVIRLYRDREDGRLAGYLRGDGGIEPVFFDSAKTAKAKKIRNAFPQLNSRLIDWTNDLNRAVVRTDGNGDSGTYFIVDLTTGTADAIAYERDSITAEEMGRISRVAYTAQDGLKMDGILTLPSTGASQNLPLVMLPHGGPNQHDTVSFDWWAQAFASRGYAVFQPNFRGSTNRDQAFIDAGNGEWGRKMQTDISDGLAHLVEQGIVDPRRVCIMGASYGGYAALAGVTLQDGLYRCAVSVNGVADVSLMSRIERREAGNSRMLSRSLEEQLGPRSGYREISPYFHANRAGAPILLIHGEDDTVVSYRQSKRMEEALLKAGKPVTLVTLAGEDHWLSQQDTRIAMLNAAMAFVQEHNPAAE